MKFITATPPLRLYPAPEPMATAFEGLGHPYATPTPFPRNCQFHAVRYDHTMTMRVFCRYVTPRGRVFLVKVDERIRGDSHMRLMNLQDFLTQEAYNAMQDAVREHNRVTLPIRN